MTERQKAHLADVYLEHAGGDIVGSLAEVVAHQRVGVLLGEEVKDRWEMTVGAGTH